MPAGKPGRAAPAQQAGAPLDVDVTDAGPLLVQHKARGNREPEAAERALVRRYFERVIALVPPERFAAVRKARRAIAAASLDLVARLHGMADEGELTGEINDVLASELAELVRFLQPVEARRAGILAFLRHHGTALLQALGVGS